jgi:excisionase family DNA binding protein
MQNLIFSQIPIDEFRALISDTVRAEMQKNCISEPKPETELLITRLETAKILGVSLVTLNEWTKQGIIPGYRISSRVRYKKAEILNAVSQIQTLKYRRGA